MHACTPLGKPPIYLLQRSGRELMHAEPPKWPSQAAHGNTPLSARNFPSFVASAPFRTLTKVGLLGGRILVDALEQEAPPPFPHPPGQCGMRR